MQKYDSYKDSGVQWIGEIPSHWDVVRLKMLLKEHLMYGANEAAESDNKDFPRYIRITDIDDNGNLKDETFKSLELEKAKDYLLTKGDVLFARSGATVGKTYLFMEDYKACFAGYLIKASCNSNLCPSFLLRFTQSGLYNNWKNSIFIQSTIQNIGADKYNELLLTLPTVKEQETIVNYLDNKCSKIDNVITTQEKRVELLRELKQSIITRAVTLGINPDAKMKDSGVEWIGDIPEHWEVMKLNNVCHTITDFVASGSFADLRNNVQYLDEPDYAMLVRTADLSQKNRDVAKVYVSKDSYDFLRNSNLHGGEIVLPNIGASIGDAYVVPEDMYEKMTLGPNSILLRTNYNDMFFYYYFCSKSGRESLILMGQAAAQSKFNKTELRQMKVVVPPIEEQEGIVKFIERRTSRLDKSIDKAIRQIELLKEYKQSLITEVVTGKRKVC